MNELLKTVERLKTVRENWCDRRYAKLSLEKKREYLVAKATKGLAFCMDSEAYRAELELCRQAAMRVEQ